MNESLKNIITSIGTSLIVSSVMFILGLKSGKNQSDRQIFKNKYREISVHLSDLLDGIKSGKPKNWVDFALVKTSSGKRYMPLIKEMKFKGETIELKQKIINKCDELETRLLEYTNLYQMNLERIKEYVISQLESYCSNLVRKEDYEIRTTNDTINKSYCPCTYGIFIIDKNLNIVITRLKENSLQGISLISETPRNSRHSVTIYKDTLDNITIEEFLKNINEHLKKEQTIIELLKVQNQLIEETNNIIKRVNKRVREPFTFIETISGAITDIVKI